MTPEHLHLALNHLPLLGAALSLIPILLGLLTRNRMTLLSGLLMASLSGWSTPLVMETGEEAYERYEDGPVRAYLDAGAEEALEVHEHRAHDFAKFLYANALLNTICLGLLLLKKPHAEKICWAAVAMGILAVISGIWIAESGGKIRRPDFRHPVSSAVEWEES